MALVLRVPRPVDAACPDLLRLFRGRPRCRPSNDGQVADHGSTGPVLLSAMPRTSLAAAVREVAARDPVMGAFIERAGPMRLRASRGVDVFSSLAAAIKARTPQEQNESPGL